MTQEQVDRIGPVEDVYPLTPLQAGMVFHSLVEPAAYLDKLVIDLDGVTDPDALRTAWQRVVDRTPVLRTSVLPQEMLQVVHRDVVLTEDGDIDLTRPPLMRVAVTPLSADRVRVTWRSHHVLLDGWSTAQVFAEVCAEYRAITRGETPTPVSRRPFREYLRWLAGQDQAAAEAYWRAELSDLDGTTRLPYDRQPGRAHEAESTSSVRLEIPGDQLRTVAQSAGLTVNTIVQGAWALLLAHHSGRTDVTFGVTVSGRPAELAGVEAMVGMFINTVPARARLTGQDVVTWLRDLQAAQVESRRHDFVSLAQIQQWTGLEPLDSVLVFENYPLDRATTTPRVVGISAVDNTTFPLTLSAHLDSSLHLDLAYDPRLFDSLTVERLAARLRVILDGIATSPSVRVDQLPWTLPGRRTSFGAR
ncbi:hypothetical protein GCM10029964_066050 [Kibdelosporangium lantanae]